MKRTVINPTSLVPRNKEHRITCPECASELNIPFDLERGEILSCPGCGIELEVKKSDVGGECLEVQEIVFEGEDWGE